MDMGFAFMLLVALGPFFLLYKAAEEEEGRPVPIRIKDETTPRERDR